MTEKPAASNEIWNAPNIITMSRLGISIGVFACIELDLFVAATICFVVAAGTDWLDGYLARKYNQVTKLGRILDPFADKILICGAFILIAVAMADKPYYLYGIQGWMAVVIIGREILVTALRGFIEQSGGDFSANFAGKLKMVFQCVAVVTCLLVLEYDSSVLGLSWIKDWIMPISVWVAVLSTIQSGVGYIFAVAKQLRTV
jgi:CDP-diacylglycerol--glycerol-3-phosphate 3-phosphatidyltransferase